MFSILGEVSMNNKRETTKKWVLVLSDAGVMGSRGSQWQPVDVCVLVIYLCHAKFGFVIVIIFFK